ncbi:MAG: hypothetical protein ACOYJV_01545 [Aminivibrio sp.]
MDHSRNTNSALLYFEEIISKDEELWKKKRASFKKRMEKWLDIEEKNSLNVSRGISIKKNKKPIPLTRQSNRFSRTLRPPTGTCKEWAFNVPRCFNRALDITYIEKQKTENKKVVKRWMEWSQGTTFSFEAYDLFYDVNTEGIELWRDCLKVFRRCVKVTYATPTKIESVGLNSRRYPGAVEFNLMIPDKDQKKLIVDHVVTTTQDGLIRFLISGDLDLLK